MNLSHHPSTCLYNIQKQLDEPHTYRNFLQYGAVILVLDGEEALIEITPSVSNKR